MISFFIMFSCFFYLSNYRSDKISVLKPKNGLANKWINTILETTICIRNYYLPNLLQNKYYFYL